MKSPQRTSNPSKNMDWLIDLILDLEACGYSVTAFAKKSTSEILEQRRKRRKYLKSPAGKASLQRARLREKRIREGSEKIDPARSRLMRSVRKIYRT